MIVVDTTVLVFAVGADHPLRDPCRALVRAAQAGQISATTTPEVVQELAHVRARRRGRADAAALARSYADLLAPLSMVDGRDLDAGLDIFEAHPRLGSFDAVLAAVSLRRGADALVSADRAFSDVEGLVHLDPGAADFDADRLGR